MLPGGPELLVVAAQRGPAVTRDVARRGDAGRAIPQVLHDWQSHESLGACDENTSRLQSVFIVERNAGQSHGNTLFVGICGPFRCCATALDKTSFSRKSRPYSSDGRHR